jgi:hypothetical protein
MKIPARIPRAGLIQSHPFSEVSMPSPFALLALAIIFLFGCEAPTGAAPDGGSCPDDAGCPACADVDCDQQVARVGGEFSECLIIDSATHTVTDAFVCRKNPPYP